MSYALLALKLGSALNKSGENRTWTSWSYILRKKRKVDEITRLRNHRKGATSRILIETAGDRGMKEQITGRNKFSASAVTVLNENFIFAIYITAPVRVCNNSLGIAKRELRLWICGVDCLHHREGIHRWIAQTVVSFVDSRLKCRYFCQYSVHFVSQVSTMI